MRLLQVAGLGQALDDRSYIGDAERHHRPAADVREGVVLQPSLFLVEVRVGPAWLADLQPLTGHHLEAVGGLLPTNRLLSLAVFTRIDARSDLLAGRIASCPGIGQSDVRVGTQALGVPLAGDRPPIVEPPPFAAIRPEQQVQASAIGQFGRFRAGLGLADRYIAEGHDGNPSDGNKI